MNHWSNGPQQNPYQPPNPHQAYVDPRQVWQPRGYEFSPSEETVFNKAGTWSLVLGVLTCVRALLDFTTVPMGGIITIVVAVSLIMASSAFKKITNTRGNDIQHLMGALVSLNHLFIVRLIALVLFVGAILFVVAITGVAMVAFMQAAPGGR